MIKLFVIFFALFALAATASLLAGSGGTVEIILGTYAIRLHPGFLAGLLALMFAGGALLALLASWIRRDMPILGTNAAIKRQSKGLVLLNQSLVALAGGDAKLARKLAQEAEILLPSQPMVHLINAETALKTGNEKEAQKRFQTLAESSDGRFIGLRGLLLTARRQGHGAEALKLARRAFEEKPKSPWALETLFALEVAAGHWGEAASLLGRVSKAGLIDQNTLARHQGALAFSEASELLLKNERDEAASLFQKALKARPGFAPAIAALSRLERLAGQNKKADKRLKKAWAEAPHPALLRAFKELGGAESRRELLERIRALVATNPEHPLSLLVLAEVALDADAHDIAEAAVGQAALHPQTKRSLKAALALARASGAPTHTIEKQLPTARDDAEWHCNTCGHKIQIWQPLCENCDHFDTLEWRDMPFDASRLALSGTHDNMILLSNENA